MKAILERVRRILARRWVVLALVWTAPSLFFLAIAACVFHTFRIEVPDRADAATRADAMAIIRAALDRAAPPPPSPRLRRSIAHGGPVVAVVYLDGLEVARATGRGATWGDALTAAAAELGKSPLQQRDADARTRARIRIDVVVGRGPMPTGSALLRATALPGIEDSFAINPGVEGVGGTIGPDEILLLPHDLISTPEKVLPKKRPIKLAPDFSLIGVDLPVADQLLARAAGAPPGTRASGHFRFRTDSFAERAVADRAQPPVALYRDNPPAPPLSAAALRAAALEGARYLIAHLAPNGRYVYTHNLNTGVASDPTKGGEYSIPRHAGTTYFLAELYRHTKEEFLREPIERAFAHLDELIRKGGCQGTLPDGKDYACVIDRGDTQAVLGSSALTVVALAEYQRATGDSRYLELATRLTNWILFMQRPDGSFRHRYDVASHVADEVHNDLYYSGEAALALARMYTVTTDLKYAQASGRALDWLVGQYDFFLGGFFYGEEHWTCIAAEAVFPAVSHDKYREFCDGYGAFLRSQQPAAGDYPDEDDLAGAYNTPPTPFIMPFNTPAGSRTEAMISAYLLDLHHKQPDPRIKGQVVAALQYVLGQQVRPESDFAAAGTLRVLGGMPGSPIDRTVRIDYVQHVCSAMIRGADILDQ